MQKIKEARDYLSAVGVFLDDEDIIILALNGLPPEYNTFHTVVRGRENVMTIKEFKSQLLAKESIVDSHIHGSFLFAMVANNSAAMHKCSNMPYQSFTSGGGPSYHHNGGQPYVVFGGLRFFNNKNKGKSKFNVAHRYYNPRPMYPTQTHVLPTPTLGVLGPSPNQFASPPAPPLQTCQLCNVDGHTALYYFNKSSN